MPAPYGQSLALLTDLYQLTMACGYWREGIAEREAVFHHYFRRAPFGGSFAIAAGLETALQWLDGLRFREGDLEYLGGLRGNTGSALFPRRFLSYLGTLKFACRVDAVPEGTLVLAEEPLVRVQGPLLQCQLVETAMLNLINFQTLVATKAARVCAAAGDAPVIEYGLRRAQGIDGGLSASRAAYIGGCSGTSNTLAGKLYGIPVKGTQAHSWVLAFGNEREAFEAYARSMPDNLVLLVDTHDSLAGIRKAIEVGLSARKRGVQLAGIRLDSGDLAALSKRARAMLDASGLGSTAIIASNDLDEHAIERLNARGARVGVWGVGTSIAAAKGQAALGGVYKLALLRDRGGTWEPKAKRSEDAGKSSTPGMLQVRRFWDGQRPAADLLYDETHAPAGQWAGLGRSASAGAEPVTLGGPSADVLRPVMRRGRRVAPATTLSESRSAARDWMRRIGRKALHAEPGADAIPFFTETGLAARRSAELGRDAN